MLGFRFYDSEKMTYSKDFDSLGGFFAHAENSRFQIMQSTGLNDMHQDPIFEQDILWLDKKGGYYLVESIYKLYRDYFTEGCGKLYFHEIGIIGNSFENPELLEKCNAGI